jgi:hypothetical protein
MPADLRNARLGVMDLVSAMQGAVNVFDQHGGTIDGIKTLIRIHLSRAVGIRRDLPAAQVDCFQTGPGHLYRLIAGECTERVHVGFVLHQRPQLVSPTARERVFDAHATTEAQHIFGAVTALDT